MHNIQLFIEYYKVFGEYVSPVKVIGAGITAAVLFALFLLVLLIVFRKKVLAQRRYPILKVLAYSYFLFIPLLGGFFAFQWGAINSLHNQLKENLMAKVKVYTDGMDTNWETYIAQALISGVPDDQVPTITISANNVVEIGTEALYLRYQTYVDSLLINDESLVINALGYINNLTDGKVMSYAVKKGIFKLLDKGLAMDESMSEELMETRLDELIKGGVLSKILGIQLDRIFKPLKQSTIIVFCIILLFPLIEIAIANNWFRKKLVDATATSQQAPTAPNQVGDNTTLGS